MFACQPFKNFLHVTMAIVLVFACRSLEAQQMKSLGKWDATANVDGLEREYSLAIQKKKDGLVGTISADAQEFEMRNIQASNDSLSFEFGFNEDGADIVIKVEASVDGNQMSGDWVASEGGSEVDSGSFSATRKPKPKKPSVQLAGKWNSKATLPNGNDLETVLTLKGKNSDLSASFLSEEGDTVEGEGKVEKRHVRIVFDLEIEENTLEAVIEAKIESKNSLNGLWVLKNQNGEEAARGVWVAERKIETEALFDGTSLDNFRGYANEEIGEHWKVEDGMIHYVGGRCGDIVTKKEYGDFELEFDWKITEGGNSGVMYRVSLGDKKPWHTGPEYQILDDSVHKDGKDPTKSAGSLYAMYEAKNKTLNPVGEWNSTKIVLDGNKVEHWLNGTKVVDVEIGSDDWNEKFAASKFAKQARFAKNKKGHICFQDHGNEFWLRNIRIKSND